MDTLKHEKVEEERESRLVAGIILHEATQGENILTSNQGNVKEKGGNGGKEDHTVVSDLTPPLSTSSTPLGEELMIPATIQIITQSQNPAGSPPPVHHHNVPQSQVSSRPPSAYTTVSPLFFPPSAAPPNPTALNHMSVSTELPGEANELEVKAGPVLEDVTVKNVLFKPARPELQTTVVQPKYVTEYIPKVQVATFITRELNPMTKSNENNPTVGLKPSVTQPKTVQLMENDTNLTARRNKASPPQPQLFKASAGPQLTTAKAPSTRPTKLNRSSQNKTIKKSKEKKRKRDNKTPKKEKKGTRPTPFPYFKDNYCPPECACYGRVVQCSDKGVDKIPYGIPYNARYVLLMNNHIDSIQLDLLNEYVSMEFLVLSNNRLTDGSTEGAFEGIPALKRLYLNRNLLDSVPTDLPVSLEELRLDNNRLSVMSEAAWARCPGLLVLSLSNNSLGNGSDSLPNAVLSPLRNLRTLNLDHNQLTSVPLGLPLSIKELYLKGNLIEHFRGGAFDGISELVVLDLSTNRLTSKGLFRESFLNATHLESLNLEGNRLKQVPRHLPPSLKTLNLEGNLMSSVKKAAFGNLKNLEHLGLAKNKIYKVAPGAFRTLPVLHQLDLCHNSLRQVPRQLPEALHSVALNHNKIQSVPRDAFCWGNRSVSLSGLVRVHLEHNLIDMGKLDAHAFRCLRGFQVVHFY
uniref:Wu:fc23c09 n=1 Tax=Cyclopterus lumpus TaxID=8103 RepID=A0A8C2XR73_CYCLU